MLLLGLVLMGYLTRRLGTAEYGRYAVSLTLINWLPISIALATGGATVCLVAGRKDGRRYAVSIPQMVGVLAAIVAVLIALSAQLLADVLRSPAIAPLMRIDEKPRLLRPRHVDFGAQQQIKIQACCPSLRRANDDEAGEPALRFWHERLRDHRPSTMANHKPR